MPTPSPEFVDRHRATETDAAEMMCPHIDAAVTETYFLPADPEQYMPSLFCCRECCALHLSEGSKPRTEALS